MGLYRLPVREDKIETLPHLMESIGFPVIRTENQENGVCYFCANPKRSNKTWSFWITHEKQDGLRFFQCGLSQVSKQIVRSLHVGELFVRETSISTARQ